MLNTKAPETTDTVTDPDPSDDDRVRVREPPGYGLDDALLKPVGNASSTCEACGDVVDGHNPDEWIICDLDRVDFSAESHALVCRECHSEPDWKARVLERRRRQEINTWFDKARRWLTRGPAETLFLRRAAAGIALLLAATALTTIMTALTSGFGTVWSILASTSFAIVGGTILLGITAGYWAHLHDREKNDRRGTTVREFNISDGPWSILAFSSGGILVGLVLTALSMGPSNVLVSLGLATYVSSSVIAFRSLETAVRADRCISRVNWVPRYDRELFAMRVSVIAGLAMLFAGFRPGAILPVLAIGTYLFVRKWYDLGPNWRLFYYGGDDGDGGDD